MIVADSAASSVRNFMVFGGNSPGDFVRRTQQKKEQKGTNQHNAELFMFIDTLHD
jgi:hypothetical protein